MKKVLVLAALLSLVATSAMAQVYIKDTKHNLASSAPAGVTIKSTNVDDICVFCHTPHAASTAVTNAPLWNRSKDVAALVAADLYTRTSLHAASLPAAVVDAVNASDARLCISCHDGLSLTGGLVNPAVGGQPEFALGNDVVGASANLYDGDNKLKNDHPIGMKYATVATDKNLAFRAIGATPGPPEAWFKGAAATADKVMWCSSCHDVHTNTHAPFLLASNTASALCLTCHIK